VLALDLETAKTWALIAISVLVALAVASAWIMKTVMQKVAVAVILLLLATLAWTQRTSLQECADRVEQAAAVGATIDTTCTFFGREVTIPALRDT
jgi:hypothetical protein